MIYELTYIITPEANSQKLALVPQEIDKIIKEIGGKVIKDIKESAKSAKKDDGGIKETLPSEESFKNPIKQKLAYPIRRFKYGYYGIVNFKLDSDEENSSKNEITSLNNKLKMMDDVIRHLIIKKEDVVAKAEEVEEKKKERKKVKSLPVSKKEPQETEEKIKEKNKVEKKKAKKIKIEEIEKKLDKILTDI